jgi:ABC-type amino acid transport substrate-binding protein
MAQEFAVGPFLRMAARSAGMSIVVVLLLMSFARTPAETPRLRLASDTWPPFTNVSGKTRLAADLVHEALRRAGVGEETTISTWKDVTAGLGDGRFDGSAAIWRSPEREKFLLFSKPYLENRLVLVGAKGSDVRAPRLGALAGKRVAVVEQYAYGDAVEGAEGPRFIQGQSDQENLTKLLAGDVDYMLVDDLLIRYLVKQQYEEARRRLEIGTNSLVLRTLHFAVRRDLPGAQAIIDGFNAQIDKMVADGTYNVILQLDWIRADVDHDGQAELVARSTHAGTVAPTTGYTLLSAALPPGSAGQLQVRPRYWVDGRVYEDWDDVPEKYKKPPRNEADKPPPALLRF